MSKIFVSVFCFVLEAINRKTGRHAALRAAQVMNTPARSEIVRGHFTNVWPDMKMEIEVRRGQPVPQWVRSILCTCQRVRTVLCRCSSHCQTAKMKIKLLQRACIWFSFAKGDSYGHCLQDLTRVFGGTRISQHSVRHWWKDFRDGTCTKDNISDKKSSGRPRTARTDENATIVLEHVIADRCVSVAQLSQ